MLTHMYTHADTCVRDRTHSQAHKCVHTSASTCMHAHIRAHTHTHTPVQNFMALVPLALILGDVTEDLSLRLGPVAGGLV
jgi:Ca2+/H+ antiporter